jgi:hypothetical protein
MISIDAAADVKGGFGDAFAYQDAAGGDEVALHLGEVCL